MKIIFFFFSKKKELWKKKRKELCKNLMMRRVEITDGKDQIECSCEPIYARHSCQFDCGQNYNTDPRYHRQ